MKIAHLERLRIRGKPAGNQSFYLTTDQSVVYLSMSTDHIVHKAGGRREVVITERSGRFDLDLYDYPQLGSTSGPQQMTASEALNMAVGVIYAVWCSDPDEANALVASMASDHIPDVWNKIVRNRPAGDNNV